MGQALYRTYRSKSFDEVIGQEHITGNLAKAIRDGRISHAYLLTGPKGVGKTSVARILAHAVNNLDYTPESNHLDIIEIDAASNRRIDEIRDIRDKVNIAPTSAKYKVYIIDEVHMLTKEAFNALLKTLEEPPAHVIFILATTDAHKLPETITSRTQRYNFRGISTEAVAAHLSKIAGKEKIKINTQALEMIAAYGGGSLRDSIGLLDQLASAKVKITPELVRSHLGLPAEEAIKSLLAAVVSAQPAVVIRQLNKLRQNAVDASATSKLVAGEIRSLAASDQVEPRLLELLKALVEVPSSPFPYETLEIGLLTAAVSGTEKGSGMINRSAEEYSSNKVQPRPADPKLENSSLSTTFDQSMWEDVMAEVRAHSSGLYAALRLASLEIKADELKLHFQFGLHAKKAGSAASRQIIGSAVEKISGAKMAIGCVLEESPTTAENPVVDFYQSGPDTHLQAINNVFGSAEVLESS